MQMLEKHNVEDVAISASLSVFYLARFRKDNLGLKYSLVLNVSLECL